MVLFRQPFVETVSSTKWVRIIVQMQKLAHSIKVLNFGTFTSIKQSLHYK